MQFGINIPNQSLQTRSILDTGQTTGPTILVIDTAAPENSGCSFHKDLKTCTTPQRWLGRPSQPLFQTNTHLCCHPVANHAQQMEVLQPASRAQSMPYRLATVDRYRGSMLSCNEGRDTASDTASKLLLPCCLSQLLLQLLCTAPLQDILLQ